MNTIYYKLILLFATIPSIILSDSVSRQEQLALLENLQWDLIIGHGNNFTFLETKTNKSLELQLPVPSNKRTQLWTSESTFMKSVDLVFSHEKEILLEEWDEEKLGSMTNDPTQPNLIFFAKDSAQVSSVGFYDIDQDSVTVLFECTNSIIDGLVYHKNKLYITETRSQMIMVLNNEEDRPWETISPEPFLAMHGQKIHGLAVDRDTGLLYWSNWNLPNSFEYFDEKVVKLPSEIRIATPQALYIQDSYLYWSNRPYGIGFTIERIHLQSFKREILFDGILHSPFDIIPVCNGIIWSDLSSKSVKEVQDNNKTERTSVKIYKDGTIPFGLIYRNLTTCIKRKNNTASDSIPAQASEVFNVSTKRNAKLEAEWCGNMDVLLCLNGGSCLLLEKKPFCLCLPNYAGPTCNISSSGSFASTTTTTSKLTTAANNPTPYHNEYESQIKILSILSINLIVVIILLILVILYLGRKTFKLTRKPKIRRRVILSTKTNDFQTAQSSSVCELIDVENCCNMNICETPCYDIGPNKFVPEPNSDDKQRLIDADA